MEPDITPAPPEAGIIKLARVAAQMTIQAAAERSRELDPEGKGVSAVYWGNIESGKGGRRGKPVPATASDMKLALMARTTGVTPDQLTEAGRGEAARVLQAMERRRNTPHLAPVRREDLPPVLRDIDLAALAPYIEQLDQDIAEFRPWEDDYEERTWQNPRLSLDGKRVLLAAYRSLRYGDASGSGRIRSGLGEPRAASLIAGTVML